MTLKLYHHIWLNHHPGRTTEWLAAKLKEGFDIHHLDGYRTNNHRDNLVLIEHEDHLHVIHGSKTISRLKRKNGKHNATKRRLTRHKVEQIFTEYQANRNRIANGLGPIYKKHC